MFRNIFILLCVSVFLLLSDGFTQPVSQKELAERENEIEQEERELNLRRREVELRQEFLELEEHEAKLDIHGKMMEHNREKMIRDIKEGKMPKKSKAPGRSHHKRHNKDFFGFILMIMIVVRILLLIVVTKDVKKRPDVSGLWIFIVLLGGIPAMIAYSVFCLCHQKN